MKSKKLISAIVGIVMSASLAAGLSACKSGHTHNWEWKDQGDGNHRQECSCGATGETKPHTEGSDVCEDCGAVLTPSVQVTNLTLDKSVETLTAGGDTLTITATVTPAGAASVSWESSDPSVASVSNGVVTPLKAGTTTITARAGGKSATCAITVNPATIEIDEAKWTEALKFEGKVSLETKVIAGGDTFIDRAKIDGNVTYGQYDYDGNVGEYYLEEKGDNFDVYTRDYEYWSKETMTAEEYGGNQVKAQLYGGKDIFLFDKFEKGTEDGEYVSKQDYQVSVGDEDKPQTMTVKNAKVRFSDEGKVVYAEYIADYGESGGEQKTTVTFGYGEEVNLPEALVGEQVTEEEWTAALGVSDTNYRMGFVYHDSVKFEYRQSGNDKKMFVGAYFSDNTQDVDMYFTKESDKFYRYDGEYGHWSKAELDGMTDQIYGSEITALGYLSMDLSVYSHDDFEYVQAQNAYVLSSGEGTIVAVFKDKKLAVVVLINSNGDSRRMEFVYGDAQVTLPTIHAGEQLTGDEWTAATAMDFENFEIFQTADSQPTTVFKKDGDTIYVLNGNMGEREIYAFKEGDKYYCLTVEDDVWKKEEIEKSNYDYVNLARLFATANKSDFTWNEASGTYIGTLNGKNASIKFVDKKIYTVITEEGNVYVNYGATVITVPEDGDEYEGGGGIIIGPSQPEGMDISEDEWNQLFDDLENSEAFSVNFSHGNEYTSYIFDEKNGFIHVYTSVSKEDGPSENSECVYVEEDGKVWKYEFNNDERTVNKTETEYASLDELKEEMLSKIFVFNGQDVRDMYDDFSGDEGNYHYDGKNDVHLSVNVREGKLENLSFYSNEGYQNYRFEHEINNKPYWYFEYEGRRVTADEWNDAFGMNYEKYDVHHSGDGQSFEVLKEGDNYCVVNDGEYKYYGVEGGQYFLYGYDGETGNRTETVIDQEVFEAITQLPSYDFDDFELVEDEQDAYYKNADDSVIIYFRENRIESITVNGSEWSYSYECEIFMPQDTMTETEWVDAIDAKFDADCYILEKNGKAIYVDKTAGIIYVCDNYNSADDELYISENGEFKKYVRNEEGNGSVEQSTDKTFDELLAQYKAEFLGDYLLEEGSVTDNYENFVHNGYGSYTYEVGEETNTQIRIQFKDGELWKVELTELQEGEDGNVIISYNNYITECDSEDVENYLPSWYKYGNQE